MLSRGGVIGAAGVSGGSAPSAASFVAYTAASIYSTSISVSLPSGTQDNDVMFASLATRAIDATVTPPSGWTLVAGQHLGGGTTWGYRLYRKTAASESGPYVWSFSGDMMRCTAAITSWRGANTSSPIAAYSDTPYGTLDTICRGASVTTTAANQTVVMFCYASLTNPPTFTPPTNFTEHLDYSLDQRTALQVSSYAYASAGATGTLDATMSDSTDSKHAVVVAIASA